MSWGIGFQGLILGAWAQAPPTMTLPDGEAVSDWSSAAALVGVTLVSSGEADIALRARASGWVLVVVDSDGVRHEVEVPMVDEAVQREEIIWLGRSLFVPVDVPWRAPPPQPVSDPPALAVAAAVPSAPVTIAPVTDRVVVEAPAPGGATVSVGGLAGGLVGLSTAIEGHGHAAEVRLGVPQRRWWGAQVTYLGAPVRPVGVGPAQVGAYVGIGAVAEMVAPDGSRDPGRAPGSGLGPRWASIYGSDGWPCSARLAGSGCRGATIPSGCRSMRGPGSRSGK